MLDKIKHQARLSRENFVSRRSIKEDQINKFRESLVKLSSNAKAELGDIDFDKLDARVMFPSLYKETFSLEEYNQEREAYREFMTPFVNLRNKLMQEAAEQLGLK